LSAAETRAPGAQGRAEAARVNARVVRDGVTLERALAQAAELGEKDRRLLAAVSYGCLRWHQRLEWQLSQLLSRPLARKDAELGALLRVGLFELQFTRVPDHAAVSACVEASAVLKLGRAKGLANAVLRRFLREREQLETRMQTQPAALHSHPPWLIDALRRDWPATWQDILAANNLQAPMWLRVNRLRTDRDRYLARLAAADIAAELCAEAPDALLLATPMPAASLPGFAAGDVSVQDAGAQLAAPYLRLAPGLRVLDACAAPGGKTAHILESCPQLAELWALDRDAERLATVAENLQRLQISAELLNADAADVGAWWDGRPFDRILVDAPCSALGVIRRHPDIKVLRRHSDLAESVRQQAALLTALWPLLAPGGRLVYVTCTVLKRENGQQIERFAAERPDLRVAATRQLQTGEANMDGFYYACLDKQPEQQTPRVSPRPQ
jgi:16S rRNA (cytosine967-C5)-methyltransferase